MATINAYDGNAGVHNGMYQKALRKVPQKAGKSGQSDCTAGEYTAFTEKAEEMARQKYLAVLFLWISDDTRYASLKLRCHNQWLMKQNTYPETLPAALKLRLRLPTMPSGPGRPAKTTSRRREAGRALLVLVVVRMTVEMLLAAR